jgi:hypothetical protein
MSEELPLACSLEAGPLEKRLAAISELGEQSLLGSTVDRDRRVLRFRADANTRERLREIVAAEAECCAFLDLDLSEEDGAVVLTIAAPQGAGEMADGLAATFESPGR